MPVDAPPTISQCTQAKDYNHIAISDTKTIQTNMKLFMIGCLWENGNCVGGEMMVNGVSYSGTVHYKVFHVTFTSYLAQFDSITLTMLTNGYSFCN